MFYLDLSPPQAVTALTAGIPLQWARGGGWRGRDEGCICHSLQPQMKMKCELYNNNLYFFTVLN